jgi:hypothetical protein
MDPIKLMEKYFTIWKNNVTYIRYDRWCEENLEELLREKEKENENNNSLYEDY